MAYPSKREEAAKAPQSLSRFGVSLERKKGQGAMRNSRSNIETKTEKFLKLNLMSDLFLFACFKVHS